MSSVSVAIPCFNLGHTLHEAVKSVCAQTRPAAEILVIDDGSDEPATARALATVHELGARVIRTPNRGVAEARNLGVRWTTGEYVVLLDADDALEPRFIERLAGVLDERADLDFVTCGLRAFGAAEYEWVPPPCTWHDALAEGGPHVSTMWRRHVWERTGGFDPAFEGYEDLDFWLSAIEHGCRGEVVPEYLLRYRVRPGSRYRRAIAAGRFETTMAALYRKHPPPDGAAVRRLLVARERFLEEQRQYATALAARHEALVADLRASAARSASAAHDAAGQTALDWGNLRRTSPVSACWGLDRGGPLDRYYIDRFLRHHAADVRGAVLEVKDPNYTIAIGGRHVTRADVVDFDPRNPRATIVANLGAETPALPEARYDCFILTQTLHIIYDCERVIRNAYRLLKPGGVLLLTAPCVSRLSHEDGGPESDYWRFTAASIRRLVASVFPAESIEVETPGNVWTCAAFLHGLSPQDLSPDALDAVDPAFPLICCVRAVKPPDASLAGARVLTLHSPARSENRGAVLLYHRVGARQPDTHNLAIGVDEFEAQLRHLRDEYEPMPLDELLARAERADLPARAVAISFDDGYLEHLTVVSPLLLKYDLPATFFVNTERLDEPHEAWWDELERLLLGDHPLPAHIDLYGDSRWQRRTADDTERQRAHRDLVALLYPMSARDRTDAIARIRRWAGMPDLPPRASHRVLLAQEIGELGSRRGHAIGAHTVHHLALPAHSRHVQVHEMSECRRTLESLLRRPVEILAYPYGERSSDTQELATVVGFSHSVIASAGVAVFATHPQAIPRLEVTSADGPTLPSRLESHL